MNKKNVSPEGTLFFTCDKIVFYDTSYSNQLILEASGNHIFILEKDENLNLIFYHSNPARGTKKSIVSLPPIMPFTDIKILLEWTPYEANLSVQFNNQDFIDGESKTTKVKFSVDRNGIIHTLGDDGLEVFDSVLIVGGERVLTNTAIETWNQIVDSIDVLLKKETNKDRTYEIIISNTILNMCVTGFEVFTKRRFLEIESEGVVINYNSLIKKILSKNELDTNILNIYEQEAKLKNKTLIQFLIEDKKLINFQNYDDFKKAYNKAYQLNFGELKFSSELVKELKKYIRYRHRIIHYSPILTCWNDLEHGEKPIYPTLENSLKVKNTFNDFIKIFHSKTMTLRNK